MKKLLLFFFLVIIGFTSCKYDSIQPADTSNYPPEVAKILVTKCSTPACHSIASRDLSAGLDFSSWANMYDGGRNGSSVIPFSSDYSYMMYSINTDASRGPILSPSMPYNLPVLTNEEYTTLSNWIKSGARDKNGMLMFPDNANRSKIYVCMQACDKVFVFDAKTKVVMRVVDVGTQQSIEAPHLVRTSPDGQYWYVVFYAGNILQKFRTSDDQLVGTVTIGQGDWNTIIFTPDGNTGFVNATTTNFGTTAVVDLTTMTLTTTFNPEYPHGGFTTADGHYLYLTSQNGNFVNKVDLTSAPFYNYDPIVLVPGALPSTASSLDPHEIMLSPDGTKYFVSCQKTNEIRAFQTSNDSLIAIIPVGEKPQEFAVSTRRPYLFVTCTEEAISSTQKGKVYVIDYNTLNIVTSIYTGYQPHGIALNDDDGLVYVANLNYDQNGPAPHHVGACAGKNGYLSIINLDNLQMYQRTLSNGTTYQYSCELLPFPYFVCYKR